jgi:very-short-patch-repair endonuclease
MMPPDKIQIIVKGEDKTDSIVLSDECFLKFGLAVRVPLKMILRSPQNLNEEEARYAMNILTHVDFLIFDRIGKVPRLVIEVDGTSYHREGSRQAERDILKNAILHKCNLPYIRFKTNESNERERLIDALRETTELA